MSHLRYGEHFLFCSVDGALGAAAVGISFLKIPFKFPSMADSSKEKSSEQNEYHSGDKLYLRINRSYTGENNQTKKNKATAETSEWFDVVDKTRVVVF